MSRHGPKHKMQHRGRGTPTARAPLSRPTPIESAGRTSLGKYHRKTAIPVTGSIARPGPVNRGTNLPPFSSQPRRAELIPDGLVNRTNRPLFNLSLYQAISCDQLTTGNL